MSVPLAKTLAAVPLFQSLSPSEVAELSLACEETMLASGETIFREGDSGDGLYLLLSGTVDLARAVDGLPLQTLATFPAPMVLGELSLILEDAVRRVTAIAREKARLVKLPCLRFQPLLRANNVAAYKLALAMARTLGQAASQLDGPLRWRF